MSKTAYVVARLRDEIGKGLLEPGAPLLQTDIATRFGVSPTPVREALRILEADGIVEYSDYSGATVRTITKDEIHEYYRLRSVVEGLSTSVAVERLTDEDMGHLDELHQSIADATTAPLEFDELAALNRSLHFAIYSLGSYVIARHIRSLWTFVPPRITIWRDPAVAKQLLEDHAAILGAMRARDGALAGELMASHVLRACEFRVQAELEDEKVGYQQ